MSTKELFEKYVYEVCKTCKNRCKELNIDWVIIENALNTIEQNYII